MAIKHVGLHANRLAPEQNNPREVAFAKAWKRENSTEYVTHVLASLLTKPVGGSLIFPYRVEQLAPFDQHAATVAATVIQWLGSNVGFSFLCEVLDQCGFKVVSKSRDNANATSPELQTTAVKSVKKQKAKIEHRGETESREETVTF